MLIAGLIIGPMSPSFSINPWTTCPGNGAAHSRLIIVFSFESKFYVYNSQILKICPISINCFFHMEEI